MNPEWIVAIGTIALVVVAFLQAIATITLAIIAVFQDKIRDLLKHPTLDVEFSMTNPDCHETKYYGIDAYYFRLRIENKGNIAAENVEVFATELEKKDKRTSKKNSVFIPLNLCWTYYKANEPIKPFFIPLISPGTYKYCTMCKVINPEGRIKHNAENKHWEGVPNERTILSFESTFPTASKSFLHPPGKYRLHIIVSAANAKPKKRVIEIDLDGKWYTEPEDMYKKGIRINIEK